eukprot:bmy_21175T0
MDRIPQMNLPVEFKLLFKFLDLCFTLFLLSSQPLLFCFKKVLVNLFLESKLLRREMKAQTSQEWKFTDLYPDHLKHLYLDVEERLRKPPRKVDQSLSEEQIDQPFVTFDREQMKEGDKKCDPESIISESSFNFEMPLSFGSNQGTNLYTKNCYKTKISYVTNAYGTNLFVSSTRAHLLYESQAPVKNNFPKGPEMALFVLGSLGVLQQKPGVLSHGPAIPPVVSAPLAPRNTNGSPIRSLKRSAAPRHGKSRPSSLQASSLELPQALSVRRDTTPRLVEDELAEAWQEQPEPHNNNKHWGKGAGLRVRSRGPISPSQVKSCARP